MSNDNTDKQASRAIRRVMPRPGQKHRDFNRYSRKDKHRKGWDD